MLRPRKDPIPEVPWAEFVTNFDPSLHAVLAKKISEPGTDGLVLLVCNVLDSSRIGTKAAAQYGPERTLKLNDLEPGRQIGQMPSDMKSVTCVVTRDSYALATTNGWQAAVLISNPIPAELFGELFVGDRFDFKNPDGATPPLPTGCVKTAPRRYRVGEGPEWTVGSLRARVCNVLRDTWSVPRTE